MDDRYNDQLMVCNYNFLVNNAHSNGAYMPQIITLTEDIAAGRVRMMDGLMYLNRMNPRMLEA